MNDFFPCIDFTNANKFLVKCGVNHDLLLKDFHQLLFKSSHELWNLCRNDTKKYLHILEKINDADNKFPEKNLNKDDVLIAIKTDNKGNNSYCLATVKEIYINDDKVYHKNLNPFTSPKNLRNFYKVCVFKLFNLLLFYYYYYFLLFFIFIHFFFLFF